MAHRQSGLRVRAWPRPGVAQALAAAAFAAVAIGLALRWWNGSRGGGSDFFAANVVQGLLYPVVGVIVTSRRRQNPVGWLFVLIGDAQALAVLTGQWAAAGLGPDPRLPAGLAAAWVESWVWLVGLAPLATFVPLLIPDGELPSPRWRPFAFGLGAVSVASMVALMFQPGFSVGGRDYENPIGAAWLDPLIGLLLLLLALGAVGSFVAVFVRMRRADDVGRRQLAPFVVGAALVAGGLVAGNVVPQWEGLLQAAVLPALPVAAAVSILRYRLYEIDVVLRQSVVYAVLSGLLLGAYLVTVALLGAALRDRAESIEPLVGTGVVAVAFQPLRARVQRGVARLLFGERDDPYAALSTLGRRLETAAEPDNLLDGVVEAVAGALRVPFVAVEVDTGGGGVVASWGTPRAALVRVPMVYRGEHEGWLVVSGRHPDEALSRADVALVEDLARQASAAAHAARVHADLKRARERVVAAHEEERRRLHRDLHDGLGPTLASVAMQLGVVGAVVERDPELARSLAGELRHICQATVDDIRRLVHDLRPPALDEQGLVGALEEQARRLSGLNDAGHALRIEVSAEPDLPELPAAIEVAVYRIAQEAMHNVVRHADARVVRVHLSANGQLRLEVVDDGTGYTTPAAGGLGLRSMRERAADVGGSFEIRSQPGSGTVVVAELPLSADR